MRSLADSSSSQAVAQNYQPPPLRQAPQSPFLLSGHWSWDPPRPTPTGFQSTRSTPNMSRAVTPVTQNGAGAGTTGPIGTGTGVFDLQASVPTVLTDTQTQGDDLAMNFDDIYGRLDELLRGAGFPPDDHRVQDIMTQLEGESEGKTGVRAAIAPGKFIYHAPPAMIDYKRQQLQPTEFQPGRSEHPFIIPTVISQQPTTDTVAAATVQPWAQIAGGLSRPQSAISSQGLPSMLPAPISQSQSQGQNPGFPPQDGPSRPAQRSLSRHRPQQSMGSLNLGHSAPACTVPGRNMRSATLPGQLQLPEAAAQLQFRTMTGAPRNLTAIAEAEGTSAPPSPPARAATAAAAAATFVAPPPPPPPGAALAPDDAASKHQAVYRTRNPLVPIMAAMARGPQFLIPPKQTSDNIHQAIWNIHPAIQRPVSELSPPPADLFSTLQPQPHVTTMASVTDATAAAQAQEPVFQPMTAFQTLPPLAASPPVGRPAAQHALERNNNNNTNKPYISHGGRPTEFRPMQAVLDPHLREQLKQEMAAAHAEDGFGGGEDSDMNCDLLRNKFSTRYYGMHTEGNASADHLTNDQNCALWLRNLPPDVTHKELLHSIRGIGRIWCTYINQPDFVHHSTAAAKVAFFTPAAARRYLTHIESAGPTIRGFRIKADYNRIKYPEKPVAGGLTRVLIITGSSWFVNPENLCRYFAQLFTFQVDEVIELVSMEGRSVVEFRFGSYRCQAQMGKMALDRQKPQGLEVVEFGEDPCETGETFISYRIATDRISKKALLNG